MFLAGQTWEERKLWMRNLAVNEIKKRSRTYFNILEIGSWAGNSAVLWADAIKECKAVGSVFCVDAWEPYVSRKEKNTINIAPVVMNEALKKGEVFKLFLHNIKASGHIDIIYPIKGFSATILPFLKERSFDLIFIDGDHSFSGVKKDLENAQCLLIDGGVVCGDDLDLQYHEVDQNHTRENKERNMSIDPKTNKEYHPGVCLAVYEFFNQEVSANNGFWMMRKHGNSWQKILIDEFL